MRYLELRDSLRDFTVFSLADIRAIDRNFHRRRLNEWQDKGYIRKLVKGYYIFSDLKLDEKVIFELANRIYSPSYISLETALSYYGLIPENVYGITSVSTRRTYSFNTKIAKFTYHSIKPSLFFGYDIIEYGGKSFKIARPEKAILDYFYLNPRIANKDDFKSVRIDKSTFLEITKKDKMRQFIMRFPKKRLFKRIQLFLKFIENA
jgi:predicted transcriptional regulator of viral defense system